MRRTNRYLKRILAGVLAAMLVAGSVPASSTEVFAADVRESLTEPDIFEDIVENNTYEAESINENLSKYTKEDFSHEHIKTPVDQLDNNEELEDTIDFELEAAPEEGIQKDDAASETEIEYESSEEQESVDNDVVSEEASEEVSDESEGNLEKDEETDDVELEDGEGPSAVEIFGPDFYGFRAPDFKAPSSYYRNENEESVESELPSSYDSRNNNVISAVRNQNPYGTCWAHAALASMEASMASKGYVTKSVDYSERHLVWFAKNSIGADDPLGNATGDYTELSSSIYGDRLAFDLGGNYFQSALTLLRWQGAAQESSFKYGASSIGASNAYSSNAHLQNVYYISMSQPDRVKSAIMKYGALEMDYFEDDYYYNSSTSAYCFVGGGVMTNHAVTVVGWDDNYSKSNFKMQPSSDGAWLIKNSWGSSWGKNGYMWLSYEDGSLRDGVATVFEGEPVDNYDNNYFYDGTNIETYTYVDGAANVFTAQNDEKLRAVGIMLADADVDYSIQIYKNPTNSSNPTTGTALLSKPQTGKTSYAGYYTIPLEQDVTLSAGNRFAVVFTFNGYTRVYFDVSNESKILNYYNEEVGKETYKSLAKKGQSYAKYGWGWEDMNPYNVSESDGQNIRLHAYTDVIGKGSEVAPTSIEFNDTLIDGSLNIGVGEYYSTHAHVNPESANPALIWSSSNENVAKVDVRGGITGVSEGEAIITAISELDERVQASINVKVVMKLESITLNVSSEEIYLDDSLNHNPNYRKCSYTTYPERYVWKEAPIWKSSNERVIKIDQNGEITPLHVGVSTISVTIDGKTARKTVYVICDYIYPEFKLLYSGAVEISWDSAIGADFYKVFVYDKTERVTKTMQDDGSGHYDIIDTTFKGKKTLSSSQVPYGQFSYYCTSFSNAILENGKTEPWEWYSYLGDNDFNIRLNDFNNRYATVEYQNTNNEISNCKVYYYGTGSLIPSCSEVGVSTPSGKEFSGWNTEVDGSGINVYPGDNVDTVLGDLVEAPVYVDYSGELKEVESLKLYPQFVPLTVDDVIASVDDAIVDSGTRISLSTNTDGADIYFTLDGNNPNPGIATELEDGDYNYIGTVKYTDAILLENLTTSDKTVTLKAIAVKNYVQSNVCVKDYKITVAGVEKGNISDEEYEELALEGLNSNNIPEGLWVRGIEDSDYKGSAVTFPNMKVYYSKNPLKINTDYTVKYQNNVNAGTATVIITGKGSYTGQVKEYFTIAKRDISDAMVTTSNMLYNKKAQTPSITVKYELNGKTVTLKKGTDYTVEYETAKMIDVGTYNVTIRGKGNYDAETTKTMSVSMIEAISMGSVSVPKVANQKYTGQDITLDSIGIPFVVKYKNEPLILGEDGHYTISYANNKEIGKATIKLTGTGNIVEGRRFVGEKNISFSITGTSLSKASFAGSLLPVTYKGTEWKMGDMGQNTLSLYIKATKSTPRDDLTEDEDYVVSYSNNVNAGTAKVIFKGINSYTGTVTKTFKINQYDISKDTEGRVAADLQNDNILYVKGGVKPVPTVSFTTAEDNNLVMAEKKDYTLGYSNNTAVNDGTNAKKRPTVKITGKGNYKGTRTVNFTVSHSDISNVSISSSDVVYKRNPGNYKASVTLYDNNGKKLASNTDYDKNLVYRYAHETNVEVKSGKNYVYELRSANQIAKSTDIVPAGTTMYVYVNGKNNYNGTIVSKFRVGAQDISKATVTVPNQKYTGKSIMPPRSSITVTYGPKKNPITLGYRDFEIVSYGENKAGKGTILIRGTNNYCGYKTITFKINAQDIRY